MTKNNTFFRKSIFTAAMIFTSICAWGQYPANGGFENGSTSWTLVGASAPVVASVATDGNARTGTSYLKIYQTATDGTNNKTQTPSGNMTYTAGQYLHGIVWAKNTVSGAGTIALGGTGVYVFSPGNNTGGSGGARPGTTYARYTTGGRNAGATTGNEKVTLRTWVYISGTTFPNTLCFDDMIAYCDNNAKPDLLKPNSPTALSVAFGSGSSAALTWTNGSDVDETPVANTTSSNTGVQATLVLRTTNLSAAAPELNDQAVYSTSGGTAGPNMIGDWKVISTSATSGYSNTPPSAGIYKYAIVHRDMAYNYSTVTVSEDHFVSGTTTLASSLTILSGKALNVANGSTLELADGVQLTNNGTLTVNGTISNSGSSFVDGTGTLNLNAGATINVSHADGLNSTTGAIRCTTRTFSTAANYVFNGTAAQVSGADFPATVNNLTIDNAAGVTLSSALTVSGATSITGKLILGSTLTANSAFTVGAAGTLQLNDGAALAGSGTVSYTAGGTLAFNKTSGTTHYGTETYWPWLNYPSNVSVLQNTLTLATNRTIGTVSVALGATLTVNASKQLTVTTLVNNGTLNLLSDETGTATLMDSYTEPTISATVKQYVTAGRNWYMSAPTNSTDEVSDLNKGTSVQHYNEVAGEWQIASGTLTRGKGYIQVAGFGAGTTGTVEFIGITNSGNVPVILTSGTGNGFNLVGNPYPSYLSWTAVATDPLNTDVNTGAKMPNGTMWYRTINYNGNSAWLPNKPYNLDDIVYNGTRFYKATVAGTSEVSGTGPNATVGTTGITDGGVTWTCEGSAYVFATVASNGTPSSATVSNLIPPMQAFWVKSNGGTLTFTNAMRTHETTTNVHKAPKNNQNAMPFIRLNISNGATSDDAVIYANTEATDELDYYDAPKYFNTAGSNQAEIYTQAGSEKLTINAMNELNAGTEVPLGFATEKANNFRISATELKNISSDMQIVLQDKQLNTEFDLTNGESYHFSSAVAVKDANRFNLIFKAKGTATDIDNASKTNVQVFVNAANQITIIAPVKSNYAIYNVVGMKLENGVTTSNSQTFKLQTGIYVVKVNNQTTRVIVKKIR